MASRNRTTQEIWRIETTKRALEANFNKFVAGSKAIGRDGISPSIYKRELRKNIVRLNHSVRSGKVTFAPYQQILKSKGANKPPREIALPIVRDRLLLRAMSNVLREVEPASSVELAQSKVARIIDALGEKRYTHFLKLDVINFYPSIDHSWLRAVLIRLLKRANLVDLYMSAVEVETLSTSSRRTGLRNAVGVPQGLAISNGLAELAVHHVDQAIIEQPNVAYFRYVDDILILTVGDHSADLWPKVKQVLSLAGLKAHEMGHGEAKSSKGLISEGFDFLGYSFTWPRVSVRDPSINRLESSIARCFTRYRYALEGSARAPDWPQRCAKKLEWHLNLIVTGCVFEENRLGWLAYFSQIRHHQLLRHLDALIERQMTRRSVSSFTPKTFVDSYRFAASRKEDESGFIPNFDTMTVDEMRQILGEIFFVILKDLKSMNDDQVRARFKKKISGLVVELERDIQASY